MFAGHGFLLPDEAIRRVKQCEERLLEAAESAGLMLGMMSELLSVVGTLGPPGYHLHERILPRREAPMLFALADRLVLILEGRGLRFRLRKPLPLPFNGEVLALLPDGPGVTAWVQSADGERRVFLLDFLRREAREL
jgi:hypothetical protein